MIKLPEKYYVGIRAQAEEEGQLPLGFATPFGTDAAFAKRKNTVDSWTGRIDPARKENPRFETYDNVLMEGFRISQSVRRYGWNGGGNVLWRIEDPRGFELEISSSNFASIVDCTTLTNGVIEGKCIWGREGAVNVLLPEASVPYQEAVNFTDLSKMKVTAKEMSPGQMVRMKDDTVAMFMGEFFGLSFEHECQSRGNAPKSRMASYWERDTPLAPFHVVKAKALNKRAVFLHEEFVDGWLATGTLPLHADHPDYYGVSHTMFSYSGFKNVAKLEKRKEAIDQAAFLKVIESDTSRWGDGVFPNNTATLMSLTAFKDATLKVVEGEVTANKVGKFVINPEGTVHYVYQHNFHQNRWPGRNTPDNLYIQLMPFDVSAFKFGEELKSIRVTEDYSNTLNVLPGWKAATVHVTANGRTAVMKLPTYSSDDKTRSIFSVIPAKTYN